MSKNTLDQHTNKEQKHLNRKIIKK